MDSRPSADRARWDPSQAATTASRALAGTRFSHVEWVAETGSTNRDLLERAAAGAAPGVVLATDHQVAGRGTKGRSWFDPPRGSLLVSVLTRPTLAPSQAYLLTMAFGVAAVEACSTVAGVDVGLKWPNDLFVGDRKLAGILAESSVSGGRIQAVVVGMGLNANWPPDVPADLARTAVALNELAGRDIDRVALLVAILRRFDELSDVLDTAPGRDVLLARYRRRSVTIGRRVRVELASSTVSGVAADVTDEGHLVVDVDGDRVSFAAGDVVHLRAEDG